MESTENGPKDGHTWADLASTHRRNGKYTLAANQYTTAAYAHLAEGPPSGYHKIVSWALYRLLQSGICYRIANNFDRCRNRCRQGILIAEDTVEQVTELSQTDNEYDMARRGAWHEYVGDFRLVADLSGVDDAYEKAKETYRTAGNPVCGYAEQEHMRLHDFFRSVALPQGHDVDDWHTIEMDSQLTTWVDYKAEYLPGYLEATYEQAEWSY